MTPEDVAAPSIAIASHASVQTIDTLFGPAGRLEAVLNTGTPDAPFSALVCHPHPLHGGTMHNKVVYNAMKALNAFGLPVLRFNFRGTGLSEGVHDNAHGEQHDVRAALGWLEHRFDKRPILVAGFSFGAYTAIRAACGDVRVQGFVGLGLPVRAAGRDYTYGFMPRMMMPKLFISGDSDEFSPRPEMELVLATAPEPKRMTWIAGADHFFAGTASSPETKLPVMRAEIERWLAETYSLARVSPD